MSVKKAWDDALTLLAAGLATVGLAARDGSSAGAMPSPASAVHRSVEATKGASHDPPDPPRILGTREAEDEAAAIRDRQGWVTVALAAIALATLGVRMHYDDLKNKRAHDEALHAATEERDRYRDMADLRTGELRDRERELVQAKTELAIAMRGIDTARVLAGEGICLVVEDGRTACRAFGHQVTISPPATPVAAEPPPPAGA